MNGVGIAVVAPAPIYPMAIDAAAAALITAWATCACWLVVVRALLLPNVIWAAVGPLVVASRALRTWHGEQRQHAAC